MATKADMSGFTNLRTHQGIRPELMNQTSNCRTITVVSANKLSVQNHEPSGVLGRAGPSYGQSDTVPRCRGWW
jgi:hypothetical protein